MEAFTTASLEQLIARLPALRAPRASPAVAAARVVVVGGSIGGLAAAAGLRAAGVNDVKVLEQNLQAIPGAGIGLDDASMAILKGLGVRGFTLERMRWFEERRSSGTLLDRQPLPYFSARYIEVRNAIQDILPEGTVSFGAKVLGAELEPSGWRVDVEGQEPLRCDLLLVAEGPRSRLRTTIFGQQPDLRYAGYAAWRGTVPASELSSDTLSSLRAAYPLLGNCLYFIQAEISPKHAVLYDLGGGLLNWLVYENRISPAAGPGKTIAEANTAEVAALKSEAVDVWGPGLGGLIQATPGPFFNDIYDIPEPMSDFQARLPEHPLGANVACAIIGDAAHPITPHMAKGSNLAMHDAFMLASCASAPSLERLCASYSRHRVDDCRRTVLFSRRLGQLRNGLLNPQRPRPQTPGEYLEQVHEGGITMVTLPTHMVFDSVWKMSESIPSSERGFFLERRAKL